MKLLKKGKLFILVGPTGVGKTTLINRFFEKPQNKKIAQFVSTYTTREPRIKERAGIDFNFLIISEFEEKIKQNFFLEWSKAYKNYYGSPRKKIFDLIDSGKSAIITVDRHGAEQIFKKTDIAVIIYVLPPSMEVLKERVFRRSTESIGSVEEKIEQSILDLEAEKNNPIADYTIVNDDLECALQEFQKIIEKELG